MKNKMFADDNTIRYFEFSDHEQSQFDLCIDEIEKLSIDIDLYKNNTLNDDINSFKKLKFKLFQKKRNLYRWLWSLGKAKLLESPGGNPDKLVHIELFGPMTKLIPIGIQDPYSVGIVTINSEEEDAGPKSYMNRY